MSEKAVIGSRQTREVKLPSTGITIHIYPSLLLKDTDGIDTNALSSGDSLQVRKILSRLIASWNAFGSESDEKPLEINEENVGLIHVSDLSALIHIILGFQKEVKKN